MDVAIESFRVQRPFLADLDGLLATTSRGATRRAARRAAGRSTARSSRGTPVQQARAAAQRASSETLDALRDLAAGAGDLRRASRGLTATVTTLNPQLRFYGPYVTVCNSPNYFFTFLAEHFSEADTTGSAQRALVNTAAPQDDCVGSMGADEPANGQNASRARRSTLHGQPYGAAITPDGRADCEAGQRGYLERNAALLPEELQASTTTPRTPGAQGPTLQGPRARAEGPDLHVDPGDRPLLDHGPVLER